MAHLHLLNNALLLVALFSSSALPVSASQEAQEHQEQINAALRSVLRLIDAGVPFLTYDRQAGEVRLHQDEALLRVCPVVGESDIGGMTSVESRLSFRLRHFRRSHPYAPVPPSPFDWEQYLVDDADGFCALHFDNGWLLYASSVWDRDGAGLLRIEPADLRALYNSLPDEAALVMLPPGWNSVQAGGVTE